jgi:hypothetical protein
MAAYYSEELKSWVRMERQVDGEWCHTSGYATREDALDTKPLYGVSRMPSFLEESDDR